ncbi:MAG: sulfite exporter TauE/SafE family protein [Alphaproteobacteria bacterium]|nr:sulfite exporter TauE/SafE family protein [Alphaproteobacteria bacterium]
MPDGVLLVAILGLISGLSIGCIGIGGVILVPGLFYLGGIPIQTAIAAAMMGYVLTGVVGTVVYARNKSINWPMAGWLCAGAMPAAVAGAWLSNNMPGTVLEFFIGILTAGSGLHTLLSGSSEDGQKVELTKGRLVPIGGITGVLSAITGTGGPLVLVPLMLWLRVPVLTAIGLSQAVQLPIATLATAGNFAFGAPNIVLGAMLGIALAIGSYGGAKLAHSLPKEGLKKIVASVLILVGLVIIARIGYRLLA